MASVSVELVEFLHREWAGAESELSQQFITIVEKAGSMNNEEVEGILKEIYSFAQKGTWIEFGECFDSFSKYPELEEDVLTLQMLSCEFLDEGNEQTLQEASDEEKFVAKRMCELILNEEGAFDNEQQKEIHTKLMHAKSYQLEFSKNLLKSLENDKVGDEEKQRIVNIKNIAESEFKALSTAS